MKQDLRNPSTDTGHTNAAMGGTQQEYDPAIKQPLESINSTLNGLSKDDRRIVLREVLTYWERQDPSFNFSGGGVPSKR